MEAPEPIEGFVLTDLLSRRPDEICRFITGLANREEWALNAVESRSSDAPFDVVATYWSVGSEADRRSISRGLLNFFSAFGEANKARTPIQSQALYEALGFCAVVIAELDAVGSDPFVPFLTYWLKHGEHRHAELAATALCSARALSSSAALEETAAEMKYPDWIIPPLLERRSNTDPFSTFHASEGWLVRTIDQVDVQSALQDSIERMAQKDGVRAGNTLGRVLASQPTYVADVLRQLISELNLSVLPTIAEVVSGLKIQNPADLTTAIEGIKADLQGDVPDDVIVGSWKKLQAELVRTETLRRYWKWVAVAADDVAMEPHGERFLTTLRTAIVDSPDIAASDIEPAVLLNEVHRSFHGARKTQWEKQYETYPKELRNQVAGLVQVKCKEPPDRVHIPQVHYAEEAYLEIFSLLIKAHFPHIEIVRNVGLEWHELHHALRTGRADVGLNNDDILDHGDIPPNTEVFRLDAPVYNISSFPLIARASFLAKLGFPSERLLAAKNGRECLFDGIVEEGDRAAIAKLIEAGKISVPRGTLLETAIVDFAEAQGVDQSNIFRDVADSGLADFINRDVDLYFGGTLQTWTALRSSADVVRVAQIDVPLSGHLFASASFKKRHPEFLEDLGNLAGQISHALHGYPGKSYNTILRTWLPLTLNSAILCKSSHAIAAVGDYEELRTVLAGSVLSSGGSRRWESRKKASPSSPPPTGERKIALVHDAAAKGKRRGNMGGKHE